MSSPPGARQPGAGQYGAVPPRSVPPSPVPPGPPPTPRRGGPGALVAVVIVAMLVVGGGAFALVWSLTSKHTAAGAPGQAAPPASPAGTAATTPSATPTASAGTATVAVAPAAAANPAAARVQALLDRYFAAINAHDYRAFNSLLDARLRQLDPPPVFNSGYATTQDSAEELTAISAAGGGELAAAVTFTSHQSPANSPDNSSCDSWRITLYLLPNGGSYLIGTAPPGYRAGYQSC
jgi:hypothetical protein